MNADRRTLQKTIQHNCNISDARHAGNDTLCIYLLKMREYYRWEHGLGFNDTPDKDALGDWITQREALWDTLENAPFEPLQIDGQVFDPFDTDAINHALDKHKLIYSSGLGRGAKPHFVLAQRLHQETHPEYTLCVCAQEYARDITTLPAMSQGNTIFIRKESLRRMLWEKVEEWLWRKPQTAMARAIACYDFEHQREQALEAMTANEVHSVLQHEIGELHAGKQLGESWQDMLAQAAHPRVEIIARAVRDLLADCLCTLPTLIQANNQAALHFYAGNLSGMRKELFPAFLAAYTTWLADDDLSPLRALIERGQTHWLKVARDLLAQQHHQRPLSPKADLPEGYRL